MNEHFLALKNKFNNEQKELKARVQNAKDDIERDEASNENKRHRIEVMQNDFRKIQNRFEETKERALTENYKYVSNQTFFISDSNSPSLPAMSLNSVLFKLEFEK